MTDPGATVDENSSEKFPDPDTLERAGFSDLVVLLFGMLLLAGLVVGLFAGAHYLRLPRVGGY